MSRRSLISALLILALSASASACVAGTGGGSAGACSLTHSRPCRPPSASARPHNNCGHALGSPITHCALRGLVQFHFLTLPTFELAAPLDVTTEDVTAPSDSTTKLTSIGSPETDRGPPRS